MQGKERGERLAQGLAPGSPRPRWPSGHHGYRVLIMVTCSGLWDSVKNREGVDGSCAFSGGCRLRDTRLEGIQAQAQAPTLG